MSGFELLAVVVFFLIGYWVVDYFWPKKKAPSTVVRITRRFSTSPEQVFDAWLDPATARRFLFATATGQMVRAETDPRVGGKFSFTDRRDGKDVAHTGEYLEIDRSRRLVFTFSVEGSEPTRVTITIARTEAGWIGILDGLAAALG